MATTQGIKLDDDTRTRLKALGAKRDRSPHWLMRAAIKSYLEREELYEREKTEDMQRWEQYQLTGKAVEDVERLHAFLSNKSPGAAVRAITLILGGVSNTQKYPANRPANARRNWSPRTVFSIWDRIICTEIYT